MLILKYNTNKIFIPKFGIEVQYTNKIAEEMAFFMLD